MTGPWSPLQQVSSARRGGLLALAVTLMCAIGAAGAHASTISLMDDPDSDGTFIDYVAAEGEANQFVVLGIQTAGRLTLQDGFGAVSITPIDPCTGGQPGGFNEARFASCPADTLVWIRADLGDLADFGAAGMGGQFPIVLSGGAGPDTLQGDSNDDDLYGDEGVDLLYGGAGDDLLDGGPGADTLRGIDGVDFVDYSDRSASVTATLDGAANDGEPGEGDRIDVDVEAIIGGAGDDTLVGDDGGNGLFGLAGRDNITGGGGADVIEADAGNDTISIRDGVADQADCGTGADTVAADAADSLTGCESVLLPAPPLSAPPPPPPSPPPADTTAPALRLGGAASQKVLRQRGMLVVARCGAEACTATAKGSVAVPGAARVFKFTPVTEQISTGGKATLKLRLKRKALRAIRRALKAGEKLRAKVTVTAKDAAGNVTTTRRTIRLKR